MPDRTCIISNCNRPASCRGWCAAHYQRWRKYGDPLAGPPFRKPRGAASLPCDVDGCRTDAVSRGWCDMHYRRWRTDGCPGESGKRAPGAGNHGFPADDVLVIHMARLGEFNAVAREVKLARESLRDYLTRRPELLARMNAHRKPRFFRTVETPAESYKPRLSPEAARERNLRWSREYQRKWRAQNPDEARRRRREHMASYDPGYRQRWNHYNRLRRRQLALPDDLANEYALILRGDPCCYCGASMEHIDHIEPLARGGDGRWDNLTAACASCNQRKNARTLLMFMLSELATAS